MHKLIRHNAPVTYIIKAHILFTHPFSYEIRMSDDDVLNLPHMHFDFIFFTHFTFNLCVVN